MSALIVFPDLTRLVRPQSIVLVGASDKADSIGFRTLENMTTHSRFQGRLDLVNPGRKEIAGRACLPSVRDLASAPDVAILAVRADRVLESLRECGDAGTRFAIVFTSGFGETGADGRAVEAEMRAIVARTGMRIYGPNCPGLNNINGGLGMSFSPAWRIDRLPGPIGVATQGGGLGRSFMQAMDRGVGTGLWCSGGNEVDLEVSDYIHYMADAPDIEVIVTVLEGVRDGPRFMAAALHAARRGKPIVALKVGKSDYGVKAAQSHTAAIAGSAEINAAAFRELGIVEVDDIDEMIDAASMLARGKPTGREKIALYSFSGGTLALAADHVGVARLELSRFAPQTLAALGNALPSYAAFDNPVDVTAEVLVDSALTDVTLKATAEDPHTDLVVVPIPVEYGRTTELLASSMVKVQQTVATPIVPVWMSDRSGAGQRILIDGGLMPMRSLRGMARALTRYIGYGRWRAGLQPDWRPLGSAAHPQADATATVSLTEAAAKAVLKQCGVTVPAGIVVASVHEAGRAFEALDAPQVAMKVVSAAITHKTDVGGVRLGIASVAEARAAFEGIHASVAAHHEPSAIDGILVEPMLAKPFVEAVVGIHRDPVFGHVCTFGLGGVSIELFKDVSRRLLPLTPQSARAMVMETRCYQLLAGHRGQGAFDVDALVDVLVKLSDLVARHADRIEELEINPLAVRPQGKGVSALDAVLSIQQGTENLPW
ncbi:acetate--CoA ligase family protein [Variovorax sp. J22P168]|uniref:acetate--CoA ligase family protein n=1 Tax=Variovorax jilinensis TaxID=3053513 RepID=UPI002574E7A9|nr:acetate--CoA ligase family protein [Variovorax sp. J22P168]MDM0015350.1 acetate--CoA ligase family protein [Variovorax sp. J22P168]